MYPAFGVMVMVWVAPKSVWTPPVTTSLAVPLTTCDLTDIFFLANTATRSLSAYSAVNVYSAFVLTAFPPSVQRTNLYPGFAFAVTVTGSSVV